MTDDQPSNPEPAVSDTTADTDADVSETAAAESGGSAVVILDVLPNGRPDDTRPNYQKSPIAYGLGVDAFGLYELMLREETDVSVSDRRSVDDDDITRYREVDFDDLTRNAVAEIEYAVEAIVEADERRFVDFFNEAEPISLRLHQLNLLPGIGKKLRNNVLDERKRGPFETFAELSDRVSGLHRPQEVIVDRIIEEIRDTELKYRAFVGRER